MRVLIVESDLNLGWLWRRHLERGGAAVRLVSSEEAAIAELDDTPFDAIVLDVLLTRGSSMAVAEYARYRRPDVKVVFVSNSSFFSDGSIFALLPNTCAFLPRATRPEDLAAVVEHHCSDAARVQAIPA